MNKFETHGYLKSIQNIDAVIAVTNKLLIWLVKPRVKQSMPLKIMQQVTCAAGFVSIW